MYDETVKRLKNCATQAAPCLTCDMTEDGSCIETLMEQAADAIEELQKAVLRLEEESGLLDELPMVDQSTPCDTCVHKGNVDFDYCHICNNEANMYKPKPTKEG